MAIKFRQFDFKSGDPYAGGPCILEDGSAVWASMSDEDDGKGGKVAKLIVAPLEVVDRRQPPEPPTFTRPRSHVKRRMQARRWTRSIPA